MKNNFRQHIEALKNNSASNLNKYPITIQNNILKPRIQAEIEKREKAVVTKLNDTLKNVKFSDIKEAQKFVDENIDDRFKNKINLNPQKQIDEQTAKLQSQYDKALKNESKYDKRGDEAKDSDRKKEYKAKERGYQEEASLIVTGKQFVFVDLN